MDISAAAMFTFVKDDIHESFDENIYSQDGFHYGLPGPPGIEITKRPHVYCLPAWRHILRALCFLKVLPPFLDHFCESHCG